MLYKEKCIKPLKFTELNLIITAKNVHKNSGLVDELNLIIIVYLRTSKNRVYNKI